MNLGNRVSIVTGGGGGIGEAISKQMAHEGAHVVVADIAIEQAKKVANEIGLKGGKATAQVVDVTQSQNVDQMIKDVIRNIGDIDILVNNAGGSSKEKDIFFWDSNEENWDWTISLNLKGVRNCTRAVINNMIQRRTGKIINIASISGVIGTISKVEYSAAKAGVIGFTKALAKEVASYGVNVNSVSPGPIATPLFFKNTEEFRETIRKGVLLGRLGKPEEIANMVVFLSSDKANFITGQNFIVDGGKSF